jgi:NAD-dependent SIR2 family protein deacetylase
MRFRPDGPDIPDELVALQEKGDTIFVCGAGVSRMVGLPSFRELLKSVYKYLGEDWRQHPAEREVMEKGGLLANQYDRLLRILERRLAASNLSQSPFENWLKSVFDRDSSLGCGPQRRAAEWPRSRRRPNGIRAI